MGYAGVTVNLMLMVLNLVPVPPLDGGRVAVGLLPGRLSWQLSQVEPYGFFILLALLMTHVLDKILLPPVRYLSAFFMRTVGLL
jgi:Zn-dependent protease